MKQVRMAKPKGDTISEMRDHIRGTPLHELGDAVLMWVNEGDVCIGELLGGVEVLPNSKEPK